MGAQGFLWVLLFYVPEVFGHSPFEQTFGLSNIDLSAFVALNGVNEVVTTASDVVFGDVTTSTVGVMYVPRTVQFWTVSALFEFARFGGSQVGVSLWETGGY